MKMVGHETQSIYSRSAIADEGMLKDAALKLARLHDSDESRKVVSLEKQKSSRKADEKNGTQPKAQRVEVV
jgi:hypothetical protein